ncbi:Abi-alpha family protein [Bradyrhizobium sp. SZCCHNS3002]|uniref:Abi-alpha family protein n=1 Tax=Bradyrhizobium sp. SZCCHNS3002 TaxID=3057310 RepID=UPI0028E2D483|nr:Abi-alpha family protein [Bradyrhizobium sp. SZCCHNS3002]
MSSDDSLIPIPDEQAKLGQEALKTLQGVGGFLKETFGTTPQDIVALLGGNYLKVKRTENLIRTIDKAKKRLERDGIKEPDASPALSIPIIVAAADESRDELQDIWAALLAAAASPEGSRRFRLKFIEIAKKLDAVDAGMLREIQANGGQENGATRGNAKVKLGIGEDEVSISVANLLDLGILASPSGSIFLTPLGREFLKAVS